MNLLSSSDFSKIVANTPLISIDLCILNKRKILVGKRINPPAKNFLFVPGGRIFKSELKHDAFKRILKNELGMALKKRQEESIIDLGSYEHFYEDNFQDNKKFSTHYVVLAYLLNYDLLTPIKRFKINEQHSEYLWIDVDEENLYKYNIHEYTLEYLKNPLLKNFRPNY